MIQALECVFQVDCLESLLHGLCLDLVVIAISQTQRNLRSLATAKNGRAAWELSAIMSLPMKPSVVPNKFDS